MNSKKRKTKLIILGSGPAGMTAALYAARAELKPIVIAGSEPGGQLMWTTDVDNFPGFPDGIQGPKLMQDMIKQAQKYGAEVIYDEAKKVNLKDNPFTISIKSAGKFEADSVILATGASARWLNVKGEKELKSKGVHTCATCDGYFYKDKELVVVGAGDAAMEEATFLTKFAKKVTILVRKGKDEKIRASKIMLERARQDKKIEWLFNTEITEYVGDKKLEKVIVKNNQTNEISEMKIDGVFLSIGHNPNTKIFKDFITTNDEGYIKTDNAPHSNIEGVFVAGDVNDWKYRQAITAAGAGCKAALEARWYLTQKEDSQPKDI